MSIQYLKQIANEAIKTHPTLKDEINEIYQLALSEIDDGGSESHEVELAVGDIKELVEENS